MLKESSQFTFQNLFRKISKTFATCAQMTKDGIGIRSWFKVGYCFIVMSYTMALQNI